MSMTDVRCPSCGAELPGETGQHALAPSAGVVQCPTCGATVTLPKPGAREPDDEARASGDIARAPETVGGEEGAPESFSGEETIDGVLDELEHKPDGGEGGS
jgi:ribosomal protein S27E